MNSAVHHARRRIPRDALRLRVAAKTLRVLLACVLGTGFVGAARAIELSRADKYAISVWQTEQGLPQNFIKDILQSRNGYLWLATFNGLTRFDGVQFTVFDTSSTPSLRNNLINRIFEDSRGRLWIGHDTGDIAVHDRDDFTRLALPAEWLGQPIDSFAEDATGRVWILNRRGWILPVNNLQPEAIRKGSDDRDYFIRDSEAQIWVRDPVTNGGCVFQTMNSPTPQVTPPLSAKSWAFASRKGGLWVAEQNRLRRWHKGQWQEERAPFPSLDMFHPALFEARDGRLLAGCFKEGLYILEPDGTTTHVTTTSGLAHDWVYCLSEDREGNVWVGTGGGGLNMLRPRRVEMLNSSDGLLGRAVLSVTPAHAGGLWMATEGAGIYRWQDDHVRPIPQSSTLPVSVFWSVLETSDRSVWLGSWGKGLMCLTNGNIQSYAQSSGLSQEVVCLYSDKRGRLWAGSTAGISFYSDGKWTSISAGPDLPKPDVRCILEASDGSIWFGTMGSGLCRLEDGQVARFTTADGLASDYVWALWESPTSTMWAGTFGGGLSRFHNGIFSSVTKRHGLPSDVICHIEPDETGHLWVSSYAGIFRVAIRELDQCANGETGTVNALLYDRSDGLSTREMSGGCQPSGCRLNDGRLGFATRAGLAIINPAEAFPNRLLPPVVIERFLVDGKPVRIPEEPDGGKWAMRVANLPASEKVVLAPGERRIELHYTGLSFAAPQRVRFRYQLEGLDKNWIEAETKRSVDYSYLPPGDYVFHVTACNSDGEWNKDGASVAFTVLPHYWQTWWFAAACWLVGSGLVAGAALAVVRRRNRRRLEALERQRALERERTRIARDIHDELGSSLTRITMFSQSAQAKTKAGRNPEQEVNTIFTTARDITRTMDEIVWAINPKHDTLGSLMAYLANFVEEFLEPADISFELNFPPSYTDWPMTAEVRHDLFLAFKEALNNVVKHSKANKVVVSLEVRDRDFFLGIADDGRGFAPQTFGKQAGPPGRVSRGNGLGNMHKRLREIGGHCEVKSIPGQGTQIWFSIPLDE